MKGRRESGKKEHSVVSKAHLSLLPSQICLPCGPSQGPGSVGVSPSVCHLPGTKEGNKQTFNEMLSDEP